MSIMTITQLEYVVAIDTYRNFGQAAEKSLVTQPTLSMQIKKLEKELGMEIFNRRNHPVSTTPVGKLIVEQARVILREARKINEIVKEKKRLLEGKLSIGVIPTIAPYLLPYFLGPVSKQFPDLHLEIRELTTAEIIKALKKDQLDAGILATPLHEPELIEDVLFYEEMLLYLHPGHILASSSSIKADRLNTSDMWMLTEGNCFRDHVVNLCALKGNMPIHNLKYESGSLETLKKMVDVEGGYTLLPELAVLELPSREFRRVRQFSKPIPLREVSMVHVRSASKRNLLDRIRKVITAQLPESVSDKSRGRLVEWR
ncbi:MAG: LysR family transcriptional regulator [Bacteroidetes bacterium]|nr:LysR family transcriptional regulator [Bacteroidota bacterium]